MCWWSPALQIIDLLHDIYIDIWWVDIYWYWCFTTLTSLWRLTLGGWEESDLSGWAHVQSGLMLSSTDTISSERRLSKHKEDKQWQKTREELSTIAIILVSRFNTTPPSNAVAKKWSWNCWATSTIEPLNSRIESKASAALRNCRLKSMLRMITDQTAIIIYLAH